MVFLKLSRYPPFSIKETNTNGKRESVCFDAFVFEKFISESRKKLLEKNEAEIASAERQIAEFVRKEEKIREEVRSMQTEIESLLAEQEALSKQLVCLRHEKQHNYEKLR